MKLWSQLDTNFSKKSNVQNLTVLVSQERAGQCWSQLNYLSVGVAIQLVFFSQGPAGVKMWLN